MKKTFRRTSVVSLFLFIVLVLATIASNLHASEGEYSGVEIVVLGVGQDAGFPQAGCYEQRCVPAWNDANLRKSATSIAVVDHGKEQTLVFEATPNLPEQLFQLEQLAPGYVLSGVFLTHAHIGHYTGLMYFGHEAQGAKKVPVYAMPRMTKFLETNGPWSQLVKFGNIDLQPLQHDSQTAVGRISVTPFLVPHRDEFSETVGYQIKSPNKSAVFIPDIDKWEKWDQSLIELVERNDYLFLDATFFAQGELPNRDMSKVPHPLVTDTMDLLGDLSTQQKSKVWFIHFNHTNPLLNENSEQALAVQKRGFNISREGLRLPL